MRGSKLLSALLLGCLLATAAAPALARSSRDRAATEEARHKGRSAEGVRTEVTPYLEVSQVVFAELSPGDEVLTYTAVAAGVDAAIAGRNTLGAVSLRYERRIGWGGRSRASPRSRASNPASARRAAWPPASR